MNVTNTPGSVPNSVNVSRIATSLRAVSGRGSLDGETRPIVVCVCGSTKFIELHALWMWELEKRGFICLGCHLLPQGHGFAASHQAEREGVAQRLDVLHRRKIDLSEVVLVIAPGGYVGTSTRGEIGYARSVRKGPVCTEEPQQS